jgi:phosphate acetyltransferase
MGFIADLRQKAAVKRKTIVFPEGEEVRTIAAAGIMLAEAVVQPILLGNPEKIQKTAREQEVSLAGARIIDPQTAANTGEFAEAYFQLRQHKGMTLEKAKEVVVDPLYYGAFLVRQGTAAGAVAGATHTTGDVMRAAIQVVGLAPSMRIVSSSFIMLLPENETLCFADCAVVPEPDAQQLASIAAASAQTYYKLTAKEARIAMLSFSTKGSAEHPSVEKVREAVNIVREQFAHLDVDGELQFDAAYVASVGERKAPGSKVAGRANVFVFPDLNSGNIGYKLVQRLAGAEAVGPIVQGLAKPYNDLSRGCSVADIVNVAAICALNS